MSSVISIKEELVYRQEYIYLLLTDIWLPHITYN